jgi:transposase-like protein
MVADTSRPIAAVAREIGVNETTLGYWVKAWPGIIRSSCAPGRSSTGNSISTS